MPPLRVHIFRQGQEKNNQVSLSGTELCIRLRKDQLLDPLLACLKAKGLTDIILDPDETNQVSSLPPSCSYHCRDSDGEQLLVLSSKACQKAICLAQQLQIPVSFTMVDQAGHLLFSYRMPEALLVSIELAEKKARTAIYMKTASSQLQKLSQPDGPLYNIEAICQGQIVTFGGGLPIYHQGTIIAAVGVSGAPNPEDDERIAQCWAHYLTQFHLYNHLHISNLKGVSDNENI